MLKLESFHVLQCTLLCKDKEFYAFYKEIGFWISSETTKVSLQICEHPKEQKNSQLNNIHKHGKSNIKWDILESPILARVVEVA
jgi:hypothetical protein